MEEVIMSEFVPSFDEKKIEKKWQDIWYSGHYFDAEDFSDKEKYYSLVEYPYPSGVGMHIGHVRAYLSLEVISRKRRMEGKNVLFPIGFDAFGLPTENYAIKNQVHPRIVTDKNISTYTKQLKRAGFSFDFNRVVDTTDPKYYRWTQWIFLKLFEHGLAYKDVAYVNYCPDCKVILSNEESQGGECDRCGSGVIQMQKNVWFLKITDYADKLLDGLSDLECNTRIRTEQQKWIGKSTGAYIYFPVENSHESLKVFTTRADTLYGATFMVIAPEHPLLEKFANRVENMDEVKSYQEKAQMKTEFERIELAKDKTGVEIKGLKAINPMTQESIPIFISDYVMITYGTGAIMAVPAHDTRDYEFAKKYNLKIKEVISGGDISEEAYTDIEGGTIINSPLIDGFEVKDAIKTMIQYLENNNLGKEAMQFRMKDWAFNRQRYWGEPIPIIYCDDCGIVPVPYEDLPVTLPMVENFMPTDTGESPLANIPEFVNCTCPKCGKPAKRETDTMPQWAGSSWYFLRYMDPFNDQEIASKEKLDYWGKVDWYNGGMEHVTRHLIYSRFWNQFLFDIGVVPNQEPYMKRTAQGIVLGADNEKMSKSRGNVVNPMEIIEEYGADTLRTFVLFISDYEMSTPWNDSGIKGARRFLDKIWRLFPNVNQKEQHTKSLELIINQTILGVTTDIENLKFNTAIAKMMILINEYQKSEEITKKDYEVLLKLLNPIAPHLCEELWSKLGHKDLLVFEDYPLHDPKKLVEDEIPIVISINGKVREKITVNSDISKEELEKLAINQEKIQGYIEGKQIVKIIVVPNKLVNIVIK